MKNKTPALDQIRAALRRELPDLKVRYGVDGLGIFGSWIRREERPDSDLDLLVSFRKPPGLLAFGELEDYLSKLVGVRVDLVSKKALRRRIGERILSEVVEV